MSVLTSDTLYGAALSNSEWEMAAAPESEEIFSIDDVADPFPRSYVFDATGTFWFDEPPPERLQPLVLKLCELATLPENWDSYGAGRIDPICVVAAIGLVTSVVQENFALPIATPTNRGTVLLEWHRNGVDLEVEVFSQQSYQFHYECQASGEEIDQIISSDLTPLVSRLRYLS
jgi:hypothetical protein